jgi:hypothetical protein
VSTIFQYAACRCGVEAQFDSVDRPFGDVKMVVQNGAICIDDDIFDCSTCIAAAKLGDGNFDDSLCIACNATWVAAGFSFT